MPRSTYVPLECACIICVTIIRLQWRGGHPGSQGKPMNKSVIALLLVLGVTSVQAQGFGSRPVRIIVPVAPGGPSDTAVRILVPKLSEALHQTLVVDNRPSNNGVAGTEIAARANPDGLTLN